MLSGIFGRKSDHPMADIKSAQAFLEDLPKSDAHKSLMEIGEWMEQVAGNGDFKLDHQFAVVRLLDEAARPHARKLAREYFTPQELSRFQENRLWLALGAWYRHAAKAYYTVFDRYRHDGKDATALKGHVPLLAARTVHAATGQLKYICAHYAPVDGAIWSNLAQIYQHAEQGQYLDTPLALYSGAVANTTVKNESGRLLGWYGCGVDTLKPLYMHLTERLIGEYCSSIDIGAQQDANSLFCFDLEHPAAPKGVKRGAAAKSSMRFIGMADMQPKLAALIKTLEKGVVPDDINLSGSYDAEPVREAAQHLLSYLAAPPSRRSARRGIKVGLNVVSSFDKIVERTDVALNFSNELPAYWAVEDISASGFRTVLPAQGADGIRIGSLLGVQPEGLPHWGAAVVRRLMRDDANLLHAGAEMLANQIAGVALYQSGGGGGFEDGQPALWLQAKPDGSPGEVLLLMKAGTFSAHCSLQTVLNGKKYLLIPARLQEKGLDYDLASFRVIEQEHD
ncbi:MAG: hypothetical protein A3F73_04245 [Gallionellales bacterium RIFCSPLOWO2_12_FULL_59_22]|nr:MAG: hypothetical protein A3H99_09955 [Gallionellales bacterium RIFCSPLOWO2_02_FULL_59_110]OGT04214.1 MAG: hypothetical protein A2Z65_12075 [Gallionellales bacterium RIFCSPLOWO2_02_58_13]OGT11377.1 MAG: hypothetical protein A3F73_04245 [Gallionellales bacterium RIFCSPLOWO2_12_FULL_59_22]